MTQSKFEKQSVSIVSLFPDKNPFKKLSYMAKTFREEIIKCFFLEKQVQFSEQFLKIHGKIRDSVSFLCEFCEIFKSTLFTEHLRAAASGP